MAFSKSVIRSQIPINCNLCETEKNIKWKCLTCGVLMCSTCKDKIHLRIGKDHKVVDIKSVGLPGRDLDFTNIKCHDHSEQSTCLFCTNCDKLVCPTCFAKVHKKHDLIEISDAYNLKIERLKKGQSKLQKEKNEITATKDQANLIHDAENSNYAKVSTDILNHEKVLKEAVEKHISKLRNELDQNHKACAKANEETMNAFSKSEKQIEEKYRDIQDFINTTDIPNFFKEVCQMVRSTEMSVPKPEISRKTLQFLPGEITQSNIGVLQSVDIPVPKVKVSLSIVNQYQTNLSFVDYLSPCPDDSMWINCTQDEVLRKVKPDGTSLKTISTFNMSVYGIAITASDDLLVSTGKSRLQMISSTSGKVTDSVYDISPLSPIGIHITNGSQVVVGGISYKEGRRAVFVLNTNGDHEAVYEHDKHKQPIFDFPCSITTTSNGNIYVADYDPDGDSGKVVVLGQAGDVINIYKGDTEINKKVPFKPVGIVTTPRDNVIVADVDTSTLYIQNNIGQLITYIKTTDHGIECPLSLAFTQTGQLYMGCTKSNDSTAKEVKLYKVNISGC